MFAPARKFAMPLADGSEGRIFASMADILESAPKYHEEPKLVIRRAPHVPVWSVWATLEGTHSEELRRCSPACSNRKPTPASQYPTRRWRIIRCSEDLGRKFHHPRYVWARIYGHPMQSNMRLSLLHQYGIERETPCRANEKKQRPAGNCEVLIELSLL
jgi:hypothetical protein